MNLIISLMVSLFLVSTVSSLAVAKERRTVVVNPGGSEGAYHNERTAQVGACECAANPNKKYLEGRKLPPKMFAYLCEYHCVKPSGELEVVTATNEEYDKGDRLACYGVVYGPRGDPWGPKYPNRIEPVNPNLPWTFRKTFFPELKAWSKSVGCQGFFWK